MLLQASQYTHKFTHSASKYHLALFLSLFFFFLICYFFLLYSHTHTHTIFRFSHSVISQLYDSFVILYFLFGLNLYPCACQIPTLLKPNKVQAFHQLHIQSQTAFLLYSIKKSKLKQAYMYIKNDEYTQKTMLYEIFFFDIILYGML